jgi:UDPglucose 6-dehydrogenase
MKIAIVGSGYVGLVTGACLADFGHEIVCVDRDAAKIAALNNGQVPIFEPGLAELIQSNQRQSRLGFTTNIASAVADADVVFIAVGTPRRESDGHADLSHVYGAAREIGRALRKFTVVVTKSTVPVGTSDEIERILHDCNPPESFAVASNPEFLREGAAIRDFKFPDRIVIGTSGEPAREIMAEVYRPLFINQAPLMFTDRRTSELIKYAANAFLATKITFINEMADLCEAVGADVQSLARGMGLDNRIGTKFLHAGPGYGGSCFPKDTLALVKSGHDHGAPQRIVETVVQINDQRKRAMARRVITACGQDVRNKTIGILGLTFKPNTDDIRDAPAIAIVTALLDAGAKITAYDPHGMDHFRHLFPDITYANDAYQCANGAHALVITTEWEAFRALDLKRVRSLMASPALIDFRNIYRPEDAARHGFNYESIGRRK